MSADPDANESNEGDDSIDSDVQTLHLPIPNGEVGFLALIFYAYDNNEALGTDYIVGDDLAAEKGQPPRSISDCPSRWPTCSPDSYDTPLEGHGAWYHGAGI